MPNIPTLLPIREVFADHLKISRTKGYELVRSGALETVLIGRRRYATSEAVATFIRELSGREG